MRKFYALFFFVLALTFAFGQDAKVTVTGKVTDAADGSPLPGVSVAEKGTTNGAATDATGSYTLTVSPNATLAFSFVGFKTQEIEVGSRTTLDVSLASDEVQLKE